MKQWIIIIIITAQRSIFFQFKGSNKKNGSSTQSLSFTLLLQYTVQCLFYFITVLCDVSIEKNNVSLVLSKKENSFKENLCLLFLYFVSYAPWDYFTLWFWKGNRYWLAFWWCLIRGHISADYWIGEFLQGFKILWSQNNTSQYQRPFHYWITIWKASGLLHKNRN